jgi:hypothetical protein
LRSAASKVMWVGSARTSSFWLLALLVAASIGVLLAAKPAHAASFTVNSTANARDINIGDSTCDTSSRTGRQCTLRAAIQETNANNNDATVVDLIRFDIVSSASIKTISPASALPTITETVTINGYTQPGASSNTLATGNNALLKVQLNGANAGDFTHGLAIQASDSTIKGLVINRFSGSGIRMEGSSATGNSIQGNFVGTNAAGTADLGNNGEGVVIAGAPNNTIGGTATGARNIISGNSANGVAILSPAGDSKVEGNFIGTTANGREGLGNGRNGVRIFASNTTIGGAEPGAANVISDNGEDGVFVFSGVRNTILSNRIFENFGLGIDLGDDDITNNDRDDTTTPEPDADKDTGANNKQNFPRIISARRNSTTGLTNITGELESTPSTNYVIEVFLTEENPDTSGHGEGLRLLGSVVVRDPDGDGKLPFIITDIEGLERGQQVSATATKLDTSTSPATPTDTSEFAQNHAVT